MESVGMSGPDGLDVVQAITGGHLPDVFNAVRILSNGGNVQDVEVDLLTNASTALKSASADWSAAEFWQDFAGVITSIAELDAQCPAGLYLGNIEKSELQACGVSNDMLRVLRKHQVLYEQHDGTSLSLYTRAMQRAVQLHASA